MDIFRYKGKWYKVTPKAYEPERQTAEVAWAQIREPQRTKEDVYRMYFAKQREDARILYPSFRKDDN
jgi:hypothetical protein